MRGPALPRTPRCREESPAVPQRLPAKVPYLGGIPRYQFRCVGGGGTSGASINWDTAFASWVSTGLFTDPGGVQWVIAGGAEGAWDPET